MNLFHSKSILYIERTHPMKTTHAQIGKLVDKIKNKDSQAFADLYQLTYQSLYYVALSILKNDYDAQDAVQDSYIKILASIDSLKESKVFIAWANKIAYNISLRILEKKRDIPTEDEKFAYYQDDNMDNNPLSRAIENEQKRKAMSLVESLDETLRTTVVLKYYQNLKLSEIAMVMDCPTGTVKSRLNTAKKHLYAHAKKEKVDTMFFGAVGLLPMKGILLESAKTVSLNSEGAFNALTSALNANGFSSNIAFTPTPSAGSVTPPKSSATTVAVATASASLVTIASVAVITTALAVPTINDVTLFDKDKYIPSPGVIVVNIDKGDSVKEVYAKSSKGDKHMAIEKAGNAYHISVPTNGDYTIYAVGNNKKIAEEDFTVTTIDGTLPRISKYSNTRDDLIITLDDSGSGVDFDSIYGKTATGTKVYPKIIKKDQKQVIFQMPKNNFSIYIYDLAGNQSKNTVNVSY